MQFKAEVFQNAYLSQGAREVHAIMTITAEEDGSGGMNTGGDKLFGIICDTSGSMEGAKIHAAKQAMARIVELLPLDAYFFVIAGSDHAVTVAPCTRATRSTVWIGAVLPVASR